MRITALILASAAALALAACSDTDTTVETPVAAEPAPTEEAPVEGVAPTEPTKGEDAVVEQNEVTAQ